MDSITISKPSEQNPQGRFPANLITDGSDEVEALFPDSKGASKQKFNPVNIYKGNSFNKSKTILAKDYEGFNDSGSASRYFKVCPQDNIMVASLSC